VTVCATAAPAATDRFSAALLQRPPGCHHSRLLEDVRPSAKYTSEHVTQTGITGWNEYVAGQWLPEHGWTGKPFSFVDEFDWDRSRDIEPNKGWGDRGDVYYLQLIDNVRKYQGMDAPENHRDRKPFILERQMNGRMLLLISDIIKGNTMHRITGEAVISIIKTIQEEMISQGLK